MNCATAAQPLVNLALTEQELSVINVLLKHVREARSARASGKLTLVLELSDGGVTKKWSDRQYIEK